MPLGVVVPALSQIPTKRDWLPVFVQGVPLALGSLPPIKLPVTLKLSPKGLWMPIDCEVDMDAVRIAVWKKLLAVMIESVLPPASRTPDPVPERV